MTGTEIAVRKLLVVGNIRPTNTSSFNGNLQLIRPWGFNSSRFLERRGSGTVPSGRADDKEICAMGRSGTYQSQIPGTMQDGGTD